MDWLHGLSIILHLDDTLNQVVSQDGTAAYGLLFLAIALNFGVLPLFFLPGDALVFFTGAFCASGQFSPWIAAPLLFAAAMAGNLFNYATGRLVGHRAFSGQYRWLDRQSLEKAHAFYEKRGSYSFILAPFLAVIRTFAPFIGGAVGMTLRRFVIFTACGSALWVLLLMMAGYWFGNIPLVRDHMGQIVLILVALGAGAAALASIWRRVKK